MFYDITPEELQSIKEFVENNAPVNSETVEKFMALSFATMKKLQQRLYEAKNENFKLQRRLEHYQKKDKGALPDTVPAFSDTGYDSADIAAALTFCLQELNSYKLNKTKVNLILYEMYASWLASKRQRLFTEHPVANEWGPQFWRVFKRIDPRIRYQKDSYIKVAEVNPGVAAFIKNAAHKYYDYSLSDLKKLFLNSAPYKNAMPSNNNGKWGKEISDSDIYVWKNSTK